MDLATLDQIFGKKRMTVLAPANVWPVLRSRYPGKAEFILFTPGTEVTLGSLHFRATFAAHSDREAIGVVITGDGKRIFHLGDSLYHRNLFADPVEEIDLLILPINGKGNNMNARDASRLTRDLVPHKVLPMHWDMFAAFGCNVSEFTEHFTQKDAVEILIPRHYDKFTI
jgi:L-ascorbate metabolism protein UlaG (beta-lactamase superfamily)